MAKRKRYSVEQIVRKLREAEVKISRGQTVGLVCRKLGVRGYTGHRAPHRTGPNRGSHTPLPRFCLAAHYARQLPWQSTNRG